MSDQETRVCTWCGATVSAKGACQRCVDRVAALPDPMTMDIAGRVAEFDTYGNILEIPFPQLHGRLEALIGRPIWTHEFTRWDRLRTEILSGEPPSMQQVIDKATEANPHAKVVTVGVSN